MQTARQAVTALKKQYSLRQVSVKSLSDAIEKQGYTVIPFLAVGNEGDVAALIHALGLQAFVKISIGLFLSTRICPNKSSFLFWHMNSGISAAAIPRQQT